MVMLVPAKERYTSISKYKYTHMYIVFTTHVHFVSDVLPFLSLFIVGGCSKHACHVFCICSLSHVVSHFTEHSLCLFMLTHTGCSAPQPNRKSMVSAEPNKALKQIKKSIVFLNFKYFMFYRI